MACHPLLISLIAVCLERSLSRLETGGRPASCTSQARPLAGHLLTIFRRSRFEWSNGPLRLPIRRRLHQAPHFFPRRSGAASASSILLRTREIRARLPRGRSATTCANYFFCAYANFFLCPAICLVKMVPTCEPPHFDIEAAKGCQLFTAAPSPNFFHQLHFV